MASNLNKIFVYVPAAQVESFKVDAGLTDAYKRKIAFLAGTGEIMTNGEVFAMNRDSEVQDLKDLLGADDSNLVSKLGFDADTIVDAINYVYTMSDTRLDDAEGRLDTLEGEGEGSVSKAVSDAIANLINNAPASLDTLKEIADWISRDGADAANLVTRMEDTEEQVNEIERVTSLALIDLQKQIDDMTGGAGSIQQQITDNLNTLDGTVTLAGTTASQPAEIGIETTIDVLGSITVAEVDGLIRQDQSTKVVLQADAAGTAKKAYDTLYGTDQDSIDALTMKGVKARTDYKTRTGSLSVGSAASNQSLNYDNSTGDLATVANIANAINSIEMWETYTAS